MIEYLDYLELHRDRNEYKAVVFSEEDRARLLNVLKRGANTLSPPDMEIIKLIGEMEK